VPQPKKSTRAAPAFADLSPILDGIIRAEIQKAIARSSEAIAEQVREQIVAALTGAGPSRKAVPAKSALAAKVAKPAKAGGAKGGAKRGRPADASGCNVKGCARPHRSKGYCAAHYQSARKYGWPMPCPVGFEAPVLKRGRPARAAGATKAATA
jgi:hypothetical protein